MRLRKFPPLRAAARTKWTHLFVCSFHKRLLSGCWIDPSSRLGGWGWARGRKPDLYSPTFALGSLRGRPPRRPALRSRVPGQAPLARLCIFSKFASLPHPPGPQFPLCDMHSTSRGWGDPRMTRPAPRRPSPRPAPEPRVPRRRASGGAGRLSGLQGLHSACVRPPGLPCSPVRPVRSPGRWLAPG